VVISRVAAHAYVWDVLGDPDFPRRTLDLGISEVTLAAAYHSVRAATPHHPAHRVVTAAESALYRAIRPAEWAGRALAPAAADWVDDPDPFATAAAALRAAGIAVNAWVVLTHSTRLGRTHPQLAVRSCFGDLYPHALCPQSPDVRDYAVRVAAEAVAGVELAGVHVEACGQLGFGHADRHDKTTAAYSGVESTLLSVCCCVACRAAWAAAGADPDEIVAALRRGLEDGDSSAAERLGPEVSRLVLDTRIAAATRLRRDVAAAIRSVQPSASITMHAGVDRWATGPAPFIGAGEVTDIDAVLVGAWDVGPSAAVAMRQARAQFAPAVGVGAYVTALSRLEPAALVDHAAAMLQAGADLLHLYHLGLANRRQLDAIGRVASEFA
jgi:hypothetical protein